MEPNRIRTQRPHRTGSAWRSLGPRALWLVLGSLLVLCAGILPILHDAHHQHASPSCPVCHFQQAGMSALPRQPMELVAPPVPAGLVVRWLDLPAGDVHERSPIVRGPPSDPSA